MSLPLATRDRADRTITAVDDRENEDDQPADRRSRGAQREVRVDVNLVPSSAVDALPAADPEARAAAPRATRAAGGRSRSGCRAARSSAARRSVRARRRRRSRRRTSRRRLPAWRPRTAISASSDGTHEPGQSIVQHVSRLRARGRARRASSPCPRPGGSRMLEDVGYVAKAGESEHSPGRERYACHRARRRAAAARILRVNSQPEHERPEEELEHHDRRQGRGGDPERDRGSARASATPRSRNGLIAPIPSEFANGVERSAMP